MVCNSLTSELFGYLSKIIFSNISCALKSVVFYKSISVSMSIMRDSVTAEEVLIDSVGNGDFAGNSK